MHRFELALEICELGNVKSVELPTDTETYGDLIVYSENRTYARLTVKDEGSEGGQQVWSTMEFNLVGGHWEDDEDSLRSPLDEEALAQVIADFLG